MENESLLNLRKFLAPEIVCGSGALGLAGRHSANFCASEVLIVTGPGVQKAGWSSKVESSLLYSDIPYVVFSESTPNPGPPLIFIPTTAGSFGERLPRIYSETIHYGGNIQKNT